MGQRGEMIYNDDPQLKIPGWVTMAWYFLAVGLFSLAIALASPVFAHPLNPKGAPECLGLPAIPVREPDFFLYNSIQGTVERLWILQDQTTISEIWIVETLAHEEAADYSIKTLPYPLMYIYKSANGNILQTWVDTVGKGNCNEFKRYKL